MKLQSLMDEYRKAIPSSSSRFDCEVIVSEVLGIERSQLYVGSCKTLSYEEEKKLRSFLVQRVQGKPVAYILGYKYFYKYKFLVNPSVLIPRPETEILVERVLEHLGPLKKQNLRVLDMGCGSGCIGLSLLLEMSDAQLWAVDSSIEATGVAQDNAKLHGLSNRVQFLNCRVESLNLKESFDVIVANPPYISHSDREVSTDVVNFEPKEALFAGEEGLEYVRDWSVVASHHLVKGGLYVLEVGWNQAKEIKKFVQTENLFPRVSIAKDYSGIERFIVCQNLF